MNKILIIILLVGSCHLSYSQSLQVMTFNIHHGANKNEVDKLDEMGRFIKESGADLVGLQEVDSLCIRSGKVDQMKHLSEITGMYYGFVRHFEYDGGSYGLGVLSKYPLSDVRNDRIKSLSKDGMEKSLALLSANVALPGNKKVVFATVHFALDAPTRIIQSEQTKTYLKRDIPVIITGDLNAEPGTKEIIQLEEAYTRTDPSNAFTFPVQSPVKKIDYILVSKEHLKLVKQATVLTDIHHSDHLPMMSKVVLSLKK